MGIKVYSHQNQILPSKPDLEITKISLDRSHEEQGNALSQKVQLKYLYRIKYRLPDHADIR